MAKLAAVVLAAGDSSRFGGENKLLARWAGRPLVCCVADAILRCGVADVIVVTGCEQAQIEQALTGLDLRFAHNAEWRSGMGFSIAAGISALGDDVDGAFIVPADMPFLSEDLLRSLSAAFEQHGGQPIVYPTTPAGEQRNPVLWPRRHFAELRMLAGPEGAKRLLQSLGGESVPVIADAAVFADVDTPADLNAAETLLAAAVK